MRHLSKIIASAFLVLMMAGGAAFADGAKAGSIEISGAWARPSVTKNGAAYLTLTNSGKEADALIAVSSSVADKVAIHDMQMDGTIMRMRALPKLPLPAGASVTAAPGGTHIMLMGLKAPLVAGTMIKLHLTFEKAGETDISVPVQAKP
ncbi:MAG: copper chaperone PCu(A)C [Parvibaculaceae bacterium]